MGEVCAKEVYLDARLPARKVLVSRLPHAWPHPAAPDPVVDTSAHSIEHDCVDCERNQTGIWAQLEVLARHRSKLLTDELYREVLALIRKRGTVRTTDERMHSMSTEFDWRDWGRDTMRSRREFLGLTREQLAQQSGVSDATIRNLESGRHKPHNYIVLRLCAALDLPVPWGAVLMIPLDGLTRKSAADVLTRALAGFRAEREDLSGFVSRHHPNAHFDEVGSLADQAELEASIARTLTQRIEDEAND
jgi:transcriptional regulator with XRE-family HTH domain